MSTSSEEQDTPAPPPDNSTVILLLGDIADTTWRMFVPTIGFIGLGFFGDIKLSTKPWLTILGIVVGVLVTSLLMRRQFKKVSRTK